MAYTHYNGAIEVAIESMKEFNKRCPWVASYYVDFFKSGIQKSAHVSKQFKTKQEAIEWLGVRHAQYSYNNYRFPTVFRIDGRSKVTKIDDEFWAKYNK